MASNDLMTISLRLFWRIKTVTPPIGSHRQVVTSVEKLRNLSGRTNEVKLVVFVGDTEEGLSEPSTRVGVCITLAGPRG